ncbi:transcriptional repressor [Cohnella sp. CFH 77786]|uniref:Fur family transcriptional regulator n=1 Tax=Cohnella sp. CFH 77786 TaxID=2662265 RepID=UPI001C60ACAD|nr:Fur family transcriptional regulator [Cohnella sp. CFH 77786]MBW5446371.1 transcriptional repressor [Cohnella sp. CFH 77786]
MARDAEWIIRVISERGMRITEQRRKLAELFAGSPTFLSPKEIYRMMDGSHPGLSFDTVYRNLKVLLTLGVIQPYYIGEEVKYGIGPALPEHRHPFICLECSRKIELPFCPVEAIELPASFRMIRHRFEVYGYCQDCSGKEDAALC